MRRIVPLAVAVCLLAAQPLSGVHLGAITLPTPTVAAAEADLAAARTARAESEARVAELRAVLEADQSRLAALSDQGQLTLSQLSETQQQAERLVVDAYVKGASSEELDVVFDAPAASDAAWMRHLTVGRVDQAREAAVRLRALRDDVGAEVAELANSSSQATQALAEAEEDVRQAVAAEARAEAGVVAAMEAEQRLAAQEAARQEAARVAARQEAEAAEAEAAPPPDEDAPEEAGGLPATPSPALRPLLEVDGWDYLRECESGGNYRAVSSDGTYRGAYQFDMGTWRGVGGTGDPAAAPPAEQDARALMLYERRGSAPWPSCGRYLP